jgi:hypothetical protein
MKNQNKTYTLRHIRTSVLNLIESLTLKQVNEIPAGFNNNIIWNLGHLVATNQRILYIRSALESPISNEFIGKYQKGTKPELFIEEEEVIEIKRLLLWSIDRLEEDYNKEIFVNYEEWITPYGNTISSFEEALAFLPFHEGLHRGAIIALKRHL